MHRAYSCSEPKRAVQRHENIKILVGFRPTLIRLLGNYVLVRAVFIALLNSGHRLRLNERNKIKINTSGCIVFCTLATIWLQKKKKNSVISQI